MTAIRMTYEGYKEPTARIRMLSGIKLNRNFYFGSKNAFYNNFIDGREMGNFREFSEISPFPSKTS